MRQPALLARKHPFGNPTLPRKSALAGGTAPTLDHNGRLQVHVTGLQVSMSDTVTVIVGHRLGKAEAARRIREGLARTRGQLGPMIAVEQESWEGDTVRFGMRALGQHAAATIEVLEEALRIEVSLPWLLAKAAKRLVPLLRKEATQLLENK
jgi:hypothetical protein